MKKITFIAILLFTSIAVFGQDDPCQIKIQVLANRFMHSEASFLGEESKKLNVVFNESTVIVRIPKDGKTLLLNIENSNCQAYCSRAKRVRQLNKGDEKLLRNLIKREMLSIVTQAKACNQL